MEQWCHVEEAGGWEHEQELGEHQGGGRQAWALSCSRDSPCSQPQVLTLCGEGWWLSPHSSPGPAPPHCLSNFCFVHHPDLDSR